MPIPALNRYDWNGIKNKLRHQFRRIFQWNSCRVRGKKINDCITDLQLAVCHFLQRIHHQHQLSVKRVGGSFMSEVSRTAEYPWRDKKVWVLEISISDYLTNSAWVKTLMTSFLNFSASVLLCSWNMSNEWFCFGKRLNRVLTRESESIWSVLWRKKSLNLWTWKRWLLVLYKNVFSQSSGVSSRAWRALLRRTQTVAIWKCLLNLEDLAVCLWLAGDEVYIAMRQIWDVYV